jgi:hypothetical protein
MSRLLTVYDAVNQAQRELGLTQFDIQSAMPSADHDIAQMTALLSAVADEVLLNEPYKETLGDGYWLRDANGSTKTAPTADTDVILFDGRMAVEGLKFRFKLAKGLEYGEELRGFADRMNRLAVRSNAKIIDLDLDSGRSI